MMALPHQIMGCLRQPELWRFVGFVSTVVGLVCYALSSSFNHLLGRWNLLKISLYSAFSLFLCLVSLFAKACQHSPSLSFKAHSAFLVLIITSVYSHFADKAANGKPDAYSLISCAAFAIMSLSLSRQTHCGFEVDVFYFFLAYLIAQLLKVNLGLAIVGIGFSYALIILRSSLDATPGECHRVQDEHSVAVDVDSMRRTSMMQQFKTCIGVLQQDNLKLANTLWEHMRMYLVDNSEPVVTDHNLLIDVLPSETISKLHESAKLMVDLKLEKECSQEYISCRSKWLQAFQRFDVIHHNKNQEILPSDVIRWIETYNIVFRILIPSEQRLCDRVFSGFSSVSDLCFTQIFREVTTSLLNCVDEFSFSMNSLHKWERLHDNGILAMFETISDLIPELQLIYPESLVNEVITIRNRLAEAIRNIFVEFQNFLDVVEVEDQLLYNCDQLLIMKEAASLRDFFFNAHKSWKTLDQIFEAGNGVGTSSFSYQVDQILKAFERKLVAKSKTFKDSAFGYFFMMNNWYMNHFEVKLEFRDFMATKVEENLELYKKMSWDKLLGILELDNNESVEPNVAEELMKEKLKLFNRHFRDICRIQSTWVAGDGLLREKVIMSLQNTVLPPYGKFIEMCHHVFGNDAYYHIRYVIGEVEDRLKHLFLGEIEPKAKRIKYV